MEIKMKITSFAFITLGIFFIFPLIALGQPVLEGEISGILTSGSYIVTDNCTVPANDSLIIEPGTTLLFSGHYGIFVYGTLIAEGTESDSIIFTRQNPSEDCLHAGIRYQNTSGDNILTYVRIEHTDNQLEPFPLLLGGGIFCSGSSLDISHSVIRNCSALDGGGLYAESSVINITDCSFDSLLAVNNGGAVYVCESSCEVTGSKIFLNTGGSCGGIYFENSDDSEVRNCEIYSNTSANG